MRCGSKVCNQRLSRDGNFAKCSKVESCGYHFACTTVSEATWHQWPEIQKRTWVCPYHKDRGLHRFRKADANRGTSLQKKIADDFIRSSPGYSCASDSSDSSASLRRLTRNGLRSRKPPTVSGMKYLADLKIYVENLIKTENQAILAKLDKIEGSLNRTESQILGLKQDINRLWYKNFHLQKEINTLNQIQQTKNLLINGIPEMKNENLYRIVPAYAERVGVHIDAALHLDEVFRVPRIVTSGHRPVLVQFLSTKKRNELLLAAQKQYFQQLAVEQNEQKPVFV